MKAAELLREGWTACRAQVVPSAVVVLLVAAMCATTLVTVGRTAAAEVQVRERLEQAGSRQLEVVDAEGVGLITPAVLAQVASLSTVERAVGVSAPLDVRNAAVAGGGPLVPSWRLSGDLSGAVELRDGRWPQPGEALVSTTVQHQLGLDAPVGAVVADGVDLAVVGSFVPRSPLSHLAAGVVAPATAGDAVRSLSVVVDDARAARTTEAAVLSLVAPPDATAVTVNSPATLAAVQQEVSDDLGAVGRSLLLLVLGAGALLVAVTVLADVLVRRADLGRRRALGATRGEVLALLLTRTLAPAAVGALLGCAAGLFLALRAGAVPPPSFTVGTAVLAVLTALAAVVPPAAYAATRDPVRVLRTP